MGVVTYIGDKLSNLIAGLGTARDKASGSVYGTPLQSDQELMDAYRGAWLPRKIVDIPAMDATRNWRNWQAEAQQITAIEAEEKRLGLQGKVNRSLARARLFGGAALVIGDGAANPMEPLNPERIARGGIRYVTEVNRRQLSAAELELDPASPDFGMPAYYRLSSPRGSVDIHPSRVVRFIGAEHPEPELQSGINYGWGDSILLAVMEAVRQSDSTAANIASLIFEAKVDVFRIPDFMQNMGDPEYRTRVLERFRLAATGKGINGALVMDKEEEYQQKSASFANLPQVLETFLQIVSGAADIPVTRLLGQSPAGMSATGESDVRNYYDRINAMQTLQLSPAMAVLDECLIRSALGSRPPEVWYQWASLWQPMAKEKADIGKTAAETIKILRDSQLFPDDALSVAAVNMLTELSVMPGLDVAIEEADPVGEDDDAASMGQVRPPEEDDEGSAQIGDSARSSYWLGAPEKKKPAKSYSIKRDSDGNAVVTEIE